MTPTQRFAADLNRAVTARGMTRADLYRATGSCSSGAKRWLDGGAYPDHATVIILADLLSWPSLVERSLKDRTGTCVACEQPTFVTRGAVPARFCSYRCRRRTSDRVTYQRRGLQDRKVMRLALEEHRSAVASMCAGCEPEGLCRDAVCPLRLVSPLPLANGRLRVA